MQRVISIALWAALACSPCAGETPPAVAPATQTLEPVELAEFSTLPTARRKLVEKALEVSKEAAGRPYCFGSADPAEGFDCSGAIYYVLREIGLKPPRSSAAQHQWVKEAGELQQVAPEARDVEHESLKELQPGDLVFWSGTYGKSDGITHVAIYLGTEKRDGHPVMINATNGRSYRGVKGNGFGVFDFRVPRKGAKGRLVGYGTPPGLEEKQDD